MEAHFLLRSLSFFFDSCGPSQPTELYALQHSSKLACLGEEEATSSTALLIEIMEAVKGGEEVDDFLYLDWFIW